MNSSVVSLYMRAMSYSHSSSLSMNSSDENAGVGCHSVFQGSSDPKLNQVSCIAGGIFAYFREALGIKVRKFLHDSII